MTPSAGMLSTDEENEEEKIAAEWARAEKAELLENAEALWQRSSSKWQPMLDKAFATTRTLMPGTGGGSGSVLPPSCASLPPGFTRMPWFDGERWTICPECDASCRVHRQLTGGYMSPLRDVGASR